MIFNIEKNVPIGVSGNDRFTDFIAALDAMEEGDSFVITTEMLGVIQLRQIQNYIINATNIIRKADKNYKITTRKIDETSSRVWKIAK